MSAGKKGSLGVENNHSNRKTGQRIEFFLVLCCRDNIFALQNKTTEYYVDILKEHLTTSARKLNLGRKWVIQNDNDLCVPSYLWENSLTTRKKKKLKKKE